MFCSFCRRRAILTAIGRGIEAVTGSRVVYALVGAWVLVQVWSFGASSLTEGPRNIDTGLKRLDVLFRWQILAVGIALIAAMSTFFGTDRRWRFRLVGCAPLMLTLGLAFGLYLFVASANSTSIQGSVPNPTALAPSIPKGS